MLQAKVFLCEVTEAFKGVKNLYPEMKTLLERVNVVEESYKQFKCQIGEVVLKTDLNLFQDSLKR